VAYQRTKTSIHTQNGISYDLFYDSTNGNVQIIQQNPPPGTKPIYENGRFTAEANKIGLTNPNVLQTIHNETQSSVRAAYNSVGGAAKGAQLPPWAQLSNQGNAPGQTSSPPAAVPDPNNSSGNVLGSIKEAIDATKNLANPAEMIKKLSVNGANFGVGNESRLFKGLMRYPEDMDTYNQDYMIISQYRYTPPNAESIFSGATDIWKKGLTRGADFNKEQRVGDVFLPMPNTVQDSNSAAWDADTMNNLSAGAASNVMNNLSEYAGLALGGAAVGTVLGGNPAGGAQALIQAGGIAAVLKALPGNENLQTLFGTEFTSKILNMQGRGVDPESILARGGGIVPNSNMEFLFKGPTLRSFNNFSWRMTARSEKEAAMIRRIIRFFKQGMAPKKFTGKSGAPSYMLGTPNIFKLSYQNGQNGQIEGVNMFKTCALTQFATNYTPDGFWAAYEKGQPLSVTIAMAFNELEPVYDTDYQDNIYEKRTDLTSVTDNMVGY
jgi:hypothetical protein